MKQYEFLEVLNLQPITGQILSDINEARNDSDTYQYLNVDLFKYEPLEKTRSWIDYKIKKSIRFFLILDHTKRCAGFVNLVPHDFGSGILKGLELGIVIFPPYRRQGLAARALQEALTFSTQYGANFLIARVLSSNIGSVSLFKSSNFHLVACFPKVALDQSDLLFFHKQLR